MHNNQQSNRYHFTKLWFNDIQPQIERFMLKYKPRRILEIGSFEGLSSVYFINFMKTRSEFELHCVDSWTGSVEHQDEGHEASDMQEVEARFRNNVNAAIADAHFPVKITIHKIPSDFALSTMLSKGFQNYFDVIYIDGSHQAPDVMCDAVLSFRLLRVGGLLIFDDYLWTEPLAYGVDPIRCPKIAIDSFTTIYCRKIRILEAPLKQLYMEKIAD